MNIHQYPSILRLDHHLVKHLFEGPVVIEEKIDGSQFSFCRTSENTFEARSKGALICSGDTLPETLNGMFDLSVKTMFSLLPQLQIGWVYRGESVTKPKHNVLAYERTPKGGVIIFDIDMGMEKYLSPRDKQAECNRLGLECVPLLHEGMVAMPDTLVTLLETPSILGGQKIEGYVVKNYNKFGEDHKILIGKHVSEQFREMHGKTYATGKDFFADLGAKYCTEARWHKAVQHLADFGVLTHSLNDIGPLMKEINQDVLKEEGETIKCQLFDKFWRQISKGLTKGFPEWYKGILDKE